MNEENFSKEFSQKLDESNDFTDIFELVKDAVEKTLRKSRAGLMLGIANLGGSREFFIGAYYTVDSNMIVMNEFPLKTLQEKNPELLRPYVFQVLLHEYLHSLNYLDEGIVRQLTFDICKRLFGKAHLASRFSKNIDEFLPALSFPGFGWFPKAEPTIYIVQGFDKGHLTYVS